MKLLALSFVLLCAPGALLDFGLGKWKTDANFEVRDAYKWLFQATRGGEHDVPDEQMAREWLENEWKTLGMAQTDEPVWEPLCKDDSIGRLNLRPFRDLSGKKEELLTAFIQSSKKFNQSKKNFTDAWLGLGKRLKKKSQGKLNPEEWEKIDAEMKAKDYPAIHHSKNYEEIRQPAYRVLTGEQAKKLINNLKKE
jgi:hypothetical protein